MQKSIVIHNCTIMKGKANMKDGNIEAGNPCPFLSECNFKTGICPTKEHPRNKDFSCAAARLFSIKKK